MIGSSMSHHLAPSMIGWWPQAALYEHLLTRIANFTRLEIAKSSPCKRDFPTHSVRTGTELFGGHLVDKVPGTHLLIDCAEAVAGRFAPTWPRGPDLQHW
jgi:hypothetical protein